MSNLVEVFFNLAVILDNLPNLIEEGLRNTVVITLGALLWAVPGSIVLAQLGVSSRWWVRFPARLYVDIFRGLPAILTIFLVGFGLPLAGWTIFGRDRTAYGILALGLIETAYAAEIFRSGIQSVDKGQMEAARSLGIPHLRAMFLVVVPQALRRILPPLTSELIATIKGSSLIWFIGIAVGDRDLFRIASGVAEETGNMSVLTAAGVLYLAITIPLTRLVNYLDNRWRVDRGVKPDDVDQWIPDVAQRPLH